MITAMFASCASAQTKSPTAQRVASIQKLADTGQLEAAEQQIWDIVTSQPENTSALSVLGDIRIRQKRLPEAEALFHRILSLDPNFAYAHRGLGEIYALDGKTAEAKAEYVRAHDLKPNDPKINVELAKIYQTTGEFERSVQTIESIPAALRPPGVLPILGADHFALKHPEKVAALAPLVRRDAALDPDLVPDFARVLLENGYVDDAADLLKTVQSRNQQRLNFLLVSAKVHELQGDLQKADLALARARALYPQSFDVMLQSARLASQAKEYKREVDFLEQALTLQPDNLEAQRHIVLARIRAKQAVGAVEDARHLYQSRPEDPDALYLFGVALVNHSDWHEARPLMQKLVSMRDDASSHVMLGMTLLNDGDMDGATKEIDRALEEDPKHLDAHYYRGVILRQKGDLAGAVAEMERVVKADPTHALAQADLGTLELQAGNLDRARQALEQAVTLKPDVPENHYQLALAYGKLGLKDKAQDEMKKFRTIKDVEDRPRAEKSSAPAAAESGPKL